MPLTGTEPRFLKRRKFSLVAMPNELSQVHFRGEEYENGNVENLWY